MAVRGFVEVANEARLNPLVPTPVASGNASEGFVGTQVEVVKQACTLVVTAPSVVTPAGSATAQSALAIAARRL